MSDYRVDLEVYNGPLDLLLFLIKRDEVDIHDIPVSRILSQYLAYIDLLKMVDADAAGEFLVMAATLMEIKSRVLLPSPPPEEGEESLDDPRLELVRQLLQYKTFKDAARKLGMAAELRSLKHHRMPANPPIEPEQVDLENVQIWDLFSAFRKLLEATGRRNRLHEVVYDDTPLALHAADVANFLESGGGSQKFEAIFEGRSKAQMIGLFLALLEMIRQKRVRVEQEQPFAPIYVHLIDATPIDEPVEDPQGAAEAEARDEHFMPDFSASEWENMEELEAEAEMRDADALLASSDQAMTELEQRLKELEDRSKLEEPRRETE